MEPLAIVVEMTVFLLYLAASVFMLVGGFTTCCSGAAVGKRWLLVSLGMYGSSLMAGLTVVMRSVEVSRMSRPDINDAVLALSSYVQILLVVVASMAFFIYMAVNLWPDKHSK